LGKSVHIHPIISILVLFGGAEAFGLLGAFLAVPVAGVAQAVVAASWSAWRTHHPDQFPDDQTVSDRTNAGPAGVSHALTNNGRATERHGPTDSGAQKGLTT
jgi:hypothetical protein